MSTILNHTLVESAKGAVDTYNTTIRNLNDQLSTAMSTLTSTNFTGDAATGFYEYYNTKVVPAITESLTEEGTSITSSIKTLLDNIQQQLLDTMDPKLGDNNRNAGAGEQSA